MSKRLSKPPKLYEGQIFYPCDEEYLNGYEVNPFEYMCIDMELRKEYEDEFGLDTKDTGYSYYTHGEQIERYAKNMLFWMKHTPNIGSNNLWRMDSDVQAKSIYVTSHMSQLRRKISELTPALQKSIHGRVKELQLNK